jgi:hypothetical protein
MFIRNTIIYDVSRYQLCKTSWCLKSQMCYSSLTPPHPVILGIQLHHSLGKSSGMSPTLDIPFPATHVLARIYITHKCCSCNPLYIQVTCIHNMRDKYTTFKGAHLVTQSHANNTLHRRHSPMTVLTPSYRWKPLKNPRDSHRPRKTNYHLRSAQWNRKLNLNLDQYSQRILTNSLKPL